LVVNRDEACRFALGLRRHLLLVAFGLLDDARRTAPRFGHDLVGIGFRLVAHAILIGARGLDVAIGFEGLRRGIGLLHLHARDRHAGDIGVENPLHQPADFFLNRLAVRGENRLDLVTADDFAHRAFGHRPDGQVLLGSEVLDVEEKGASVLDDPKDREVDVDDVFIAGQHQAFFGHVARGLGIVGLAGQDVTDIELIFARDLGRLDTLDRPGDVIIDARRGAADKLAEAQDHTLFIGIDDIDSREQPDHDHDKTRDHGTAAAEAARQGLPELLLAALQKLFEIGRRAASRAATPRTASATTGASAAILIVPRHGSS